MLTIILFEALMLCNLKWDACELHVDGPSKQVFIWMLHQHEQLLEDTSFQAVILGPRFPSMCKPTLLSKWLPGFPTLFCIKPVKDRGHRNYRGRSLPIGFWKWCIWSSLPYSTGWDSVTWSQASSLWKISKWTISSLLVSSIASFLGSFLCQGSI